MTDHPRAPLVASLLGAFQRVDPANANVPYVDWLNGTPRGSLPPNRWYPLPVLDPEVGRDDAWRRLRLEVVR